MEDKEMLTIPYAIHEGEMSRLERDVKRLWILCIIIFLALVLTNAGWIHYEAQFTDEVITEEVSQDVDTGDGNANITGIGDIYGESQADGQEND